MAKDVLWIMGKEVRVTESIDLLIAYMLLAQALRDTIDSNHSHGERWRRRPETISG